MLYPDDSGVWASDNGQTYYTYIPDTDSDASAGDSGADSYDGGYYEEPSGDTGSYSPLYVYDSDGLQYELWLNEEGNYFDYRGMIYTLWDDGVYDYNGTYYSYY